MKLRLYAAALVFAAVAPVSAVGQELPGAPVKSGEHDIFTRLVFYLPEVRDWQVGRTETGYGLRLEGEPIGFDLSGVFDFIPRSRIAELNQQEGKIDIDLACNCHARVFEHRPDILVIDIVNGAPEAEGPYEARLGTEIQDEATSQIAGQPALRDSDRIFPDLLDKTFPKAVGPIPLWPSADEPAPEVPELADMRRGLSEQIGRAMTQGLLEPSLDADETDTVAKQQGAAAPAQIRNAAIRGAGNDTFLSSHTAFDEILAPAAGDVAATVCWPAADFELAELDGADALGFLDNPVTTGVKAGPAARARNLGALGFGAEMRSVLKDAADDAELGALRLIAELMDEPLVPNEAIAVKLRGQAGCNTAGSIWALVATGGRGIDGRIDGEAVVREFGDLTPELRRHVGPALSAALGEAGLHKPAYAVAEAARRAGGDVARTEITGDPAEAEIGEPEVDGTVAGVTTMIGLLDRVIAGRSEGTDDLFAEAEALSHEAKGSDEGARLFATLASALAVDGRFREARSLTERMQRSKFADAYDFDTVARDFYRTLAKTGNDGELAYFAMRHLASANEPDLTPDVRLTMGSRLASLGFADQARLMIAGGDMADTKEWRLVAAEIALSTEEPVEALARLAGIEDERADMLRAAALKQVGAAHDAADILLRAGEGGTAGRDAWRNADWATARGLLDSDARRAIAGRLADEEANAGTPTPGVRATGSLQPGRQLLSQSAELRAWIEAALSGESTTNTAPEPEV